MANKKLHICNQINCNNLTRDSYCHIHQKEHQKRVKEQNKIYKKNRKDTKEQNFYNSKEWIKTRNYILMRDNYLCQLCFKEGRIKPAEIVHHIEELKDAWDKRLEINNLISVCKNCHNKIHKSPPLLDFFHNLP